MTKEDFLDLFLMDIITVKEDDDVKNVMVCDFDRRMGRIQLAAIRYYDPRYSDFYDTIDDFIRCIGEDEDEDERVDELEEVVSGNRYWMDYRDVDSDF